MNKEDIQKVIEVLKKEKKRNFSQSYDLIVNLRHIDPKTDPQEFFVNLPHPKLKKPKVAAFVGQELAEQADKVCDLAIGEVDFKKYDPKAAKKLVQNYDYFIAQANLMPKVAQAFGKDLGTKGKMPNPKLGCVVPPNANLAQLVKRLQSTVKLSAKKGANFQCIVGKEGQEDQVVDNVLAVYNFLIKNLPQEHHNIKSIQLKLTMSKAVKVEQ